MKFPSIEIPQADTLDLVVQLLALIWKDKEQSPRIVARDLGVDPRQVLYYKHAARILGFVEFRGAKAELTALGKQFMQTTRVGDRERVIHDAVLRTPVVAQLLSERRGEELSQRVVVQFLRDHSMLTGTTIPRRAQTLRTWIRDVSDFDPLDPGSLARKASEDAEQQYRAYRTHEEGPLHKSLKIAISEDPLRHLGERLDLIQVEYPFPTNDRADVLFVDQKGHMYVVEVEVDVGPRDLPGLLQAIKYKHMLAAILGLQASEVRGVLVARAIDPAIEARAKFYGIECKRVVGVI